MRRIGVLLFAVAIIFSFSGCQKDYKYGVYEIDIIESELSNNSVGNEWQKSYKCDGEIINSGQRWTIPLDSLEKKIIDITVVETDKWSDIGVGSVKVLLIDGFDASTNITVVENNGRYVGNEAEWEICCKVTLIKKLKKAP